MTDKKLNCYKCKHFQIRYLDKIYPYGCKALGFKSAERNWYWLILPCPRYEENPARIQRRKKNK